ncbi:peptidase M50B-like protein [Staphylococcus hominis]
MDYLQQFLTTNIILNIYLIIIIAIFYIIIHQNRHRSFNQYLDIYLNYIPVLTHEMGHILFNKLSGGHAKDIVIVVRPSERKETSQQGYAITQSKSVIGQGFTTLGGYVMPPIMLIIGFGTIHFNYPSLFLIIYSLIFIYYLILTSRKLSPIIVLMIFISLLYFLLHANNQFVIIYIVITLYHLILGVLLGEVLQSSWTIISLTLQKRKTRWDGNALAELTHLPTLFYSLFWIMINGISLYLIYKFMI